MGQATSSHHQKSFVQAWGLPSFPPRSAFIPGLPMPPPPPPPPVHILYVQYTGGGGGTFKEFPPSPLPKLTYAIKLIGALFPGRWGATNGFPSLFKKS